MTPIWNTRIQLETVPRSHEAGIQGQWHRPKRRFWWSKYVRLLVQVEGFTVLLSIVCKVCFDCPGRRVRVESMATMGMTTHWQHGSCSYLIFLVLTGLVVFNTSGYVSSNLLVWSRIMVVLSIDYKSSTNMTLSMLTNCRMTAIELGFDSKPGLRVHWIVSLVVTYCCGRKLLSISSTDGPVFGMGGACNITWRALRRPKWGRILPAGSMGPRKDQSPTINLTGPEGLTMLDQSIRVHNSSRSRARSFLNLFIIIEKDTQITCTVRKKRKSKRVHSSASFILQQAWAPCGPY